MIIHLPRYFQMCECSETGTKGEINKSTPEKPRTTARLTGKVALSLLNECDRRINIGFFAAKLIQVVVLSIFF